ncbi:MAG TPA: DUF4035 domain-containing protein [Symbiobacteriaceae bacterium]|nr:DUF4035 domain-containing protein [Symbiobacteriaceae bacterium]
MAQLLSEVSSAELSEWMTYYQLEPWGTGSEDLRAGIISSTIANANRDPKQRQQPYAPGDFIPRRDDSEVEEQSPDDQMQILQRLTAAWAAKEP